MNPSLTPNGYFSVPVTSASSPPVPGWQPLKDGLTKLLQSVLISAICSWLPSKWTRSELGFDDTCKLITPSEIPTKLGMFRNARAGVLKTLLSCPCLWEECLRAVAVLQANCHW